MLQVTGLQVFDGPSVYSHKPVARLSLKMGGYIDTPSTELPGLYDHLLKFFPGLTAHYCSRGHEGGFLERLREGTYLAHIIEHLCLELQGVLGYDIKYGKTRRTEGDCYDVVIAYENKYIIKHCISFIIDFVVYFLEDRYFPFKERLEGIQRINSKKATIARQNIATPIISITGTSGKTAVAMLISSLIRQNGLNAGIASANGIFVNNRPIEKKASSLYQNAKRIMGAANIDYAIIEGSRESILYEGLPYFKADLSVLTRMNIDIKERTDTIDDPVHVKSLMVEAVKRDGVSVLNGDDPYVLEFMDRARGRIILYSTNKNTPIINKHMKRGGEAIYLDNDTVFYKKGRHKQLMFSLVDVLQLNVVNNDVHNVLAAAAACFALGIPVKASTNHFFQKEGAISTNKV